MTDFDSLYNFGENGQYINTVNEIPKGSSLKIEYDREKKTFILDRVEPAIFAKPTNYGFIPSTTDEDGDPLDTLIITNEPLPTGVVVKAKVLGVMNFVDGGENDHKIICVPDDDRDNGDSLNSLEDLSDQFKNQIAHHFTHYKDLKKLDSTKVEGWAGVNEAWQIIEDCVNRYESSKT